MRRVVCLASALLAALALAVWAQETVFRTGVSLVRVDAQVTDGTKGIDHLEKEDFIVKDNGSEQPILYCSQEDQAMDILLLFDSSASMAPAIRRVAASAHTALQELHQGDRVAVANFNTDGWLIGGFESDLSVVETTVGRVVDLRYGGGTHILSSVYDAATYFMKSADPHRRHAVLIFTDDDGQPSMSERRVVNHLWESDIMLCGLIIETPDSQRHTQSGSPMGSEAMLGVAAKTGGETVNADDPGHAFREMLHRMRMRYSIYYQMPGGKAGSSREVSIQLSPRAKAKYPTGQVLARKGYVIPKVK
jgi:VWFA-related protein